MLRHQPQPLQDDDPSKRSLRKPPNHAAKFLSTMSVDDKIGQLSQIDILKLVQNDRGEFEVNDTAIDYFIGQQGIGSVFNTYQPRALTAQEHRPIAVAIQTKAKEYSRPPVIWGLDSVHGANFIHGAIVTPQPINLAASFNTTVAYDGGKLASRDTRAAGINWLFSPLLGIALEPKWSRVFETFGEDPVVVSRMAHAMVDGIQQVDMTKGVTPSRAAACAKHFVGYSMPRDGHDRSPSWIPTRHLYQYFVLPWKNLTAYTVMESYTEYDGVPNVANRESLNYLLRQRLGFRGMVVTDSEEMRHLHAWHMNAETDQEAIITSLRHGSVDMSMIPLEYEQFAASVRMGMSQERLDMKRLDESALRVLELKEKIGMFDEEILLDDPNLELIGTDVDSMLEVVHQSIILTKNSENLLPMSSSSHRRPKVLVTGPTANSLIFQSGSWTGRWQGAPNEKDWFTYGETVLEALTRDDAYDVSFSCGTGILGGECDETAASNGEVDLSNELLASSKKHTAIGRAASASSDVDMIVVCVGEESSTEKPGDIRELSLPEGQYELVRQLRMNSSAKIVLVYFGGRPRLLRDMVENSDAVIVGFLPGPSAGTAIANIMAGKVNPSARLPMTYPRYEDGAGAPYFHSVSDQCTKGGGALPHWNFSLCEVQWPFGHGLSYTTFEYADFSASGGIDEDLRLSVRVTNNGSMAGAEAVLFFTFDDFRSTTPEYKRLRAFDKVFLEPGEYAMVNKTVPLDELMFIGPNDDKHYVIDPGMKSWAGVGADTDCRANNASSLCVPLASKNPERKYMGACEAACDVWTNSGCAGQYRLSPSSCLAKCAVAVSHTSESMDLGKDGWGWTYVNCLESVVWNVMQSGPDECWQMTSFCRDIFEPDMSSGGLHFFGTSVGIDQGIIPTVNFVAMSIGFVSSLMIVFFLRGRRMPKTQRGRATEFAENDTVQLTGTNLPSYQTHSGRNGHK